MGIQKIKMLTGTTLALLLSGVAIYPAMATPAARTNGTLLSQSNSGGNSGDMTDNTVKATVRRVVNNEITLALPNGDIQRITLPRLERERLNLRPGVEVEARMENGKLVPLELTVSQRPDTMNDRAIKMNDREISNRNLGNIAQAEENPVDSNLNPTQKPEVGPIPPDPSSSDMSPSMDNQMPSDMQPSDRNMMNDRNTNNNNFNNSNTNDRNLNPTERPEVGPNDRNMSPSDMTPSTNMSPDRGAPSSVGQPSNRTQTPATNFNTSSPNGEIRGQVESYDGTNVRVRLSDGTVRTYNLDSQNNQQMNMSPGQGVIIRTDDNGVTDVQPTIRGYW